MTKKQIENPFPVTTYLGSAYFCDRHEETTLLLSHIKNGNSTTLIALRRIGKTGLIQHVLGQLPKEFRGIYVDILETENLNQFLNHLATSIINSVPEKSTMGEKFWNLLKSLRPIISYDMLSSLPQASFDIKQKEVELNIQSIFQFLENQNQKIVVAIDEFQQITKYPEKNTDAWLRARIQQLHNVVFIFSGSQQNLMAELFTSPQRPFFRSTQLMKLSKLPTYAYSNFIISVFNNYNKNIPATVAGEILNWTNNHTFYVQQLCNRVFAKTLKNVTTELWKHEAHQILSEQEPFFFTIRNMLTKPQWHLLKALAIDGMVFQPTANRFLKKHNLGTSATVLRSLTSLINYELVYKDFDESGNPFYSVYDVYLQRWAESI